MTEPDDKLSRSEERRLLELGRRVFAEHFPNPARTGCPPQDTLRAMAFRSKRLAKTDLPVQHLTVCSPCFQDYARYRRLAFNQMILRGALAAAVAVVLIGAAVFGIGRGWFQRPSEPLIAATLDLRPLSAARGEEPTQGGTVLTLPRGRLQITIQLPVGSEDGAYDVGVMLSGRALQSGQGTARAENSVMVLTVQMDLRSLGPGRYALSVRRVGSGWQEYPLRLE